MADTRQIVSWSLERKCVFRRGEDWFRPDKTYRQLADLRTVASASQDNRVVGGICVTSWTTGKDNSGNYHDVPCDGFRIEDRLGSFGGLDIVLQTCKQCEANVENKCEMKIAGCFGFLDIWPDSPELDEQLWKIITERGLEDRLRAAFPVTTPLWYGFWIDSPLRRAQAEFLFELLGAACDDNDPQDHDVVHFLNALKAALSWELPVHVSLAPLGHTDLGWHTVFPHCPRCNANARVGRWKDAFPDEPYQCKVCGHTFNPNEHHSSVRDEHDWEAACLEKQLGELGYEEFLRRFLLHRGCTEKQVEEVFDNKNNGPLLRQVAAVRRKRQATLRKLRKDFESVQQESNLPRNLTLALTEGIELEFVLVPAGEFLMGSPQAEDSGDESPQHVVRLEPSFYIGRFLITQEQWQAVMGSNPSRHQGGPDLPVDQVSWLDSQEFCERLCSRYKRVFRLPSEAEWEYACRASTTTRFAFGDSLSVDQANYTPLAEHFVTPPESELEMLAESEMENKSRRKNRPVPVGSYPPNAWGVYDMHGNVEEWCEDVWHGNYVGAPNDGSAWLSGEDKEPFRVMRGGWCSATENVCRSASRRAVRADAGSRHVDRTDDDHGFLAAMFEIMYTPYGFRVVCEA